MPATIATVSAPAASAAPSSTAPVQTSAPADVKAPGDAKAEPSKAAPPKETPAEKAQRLKFKAKIDGKEEDVEWDEAEAARTYQKSKHYERTRGDFDKRVRDFEAREAAALNDPLGYFRQRNVDLAELGRQEAAQQAELAKLTPEAKAARMAEDRAIAAEKQLEEFRAEQTKTAEQSRHNELVQNTVRTLDGAIKLSGRQRSGELVKLFSEVMEMAEHAGEPALSPEQLFTAGERLEAKRFVAGAKRAATDAAWRARNGPVMKELAQAILPAMEGQELIDFVGPANAMKLTRALLGAYRKNPLPQVPEPGVADTQAPAPKRNDEDSQAMFRQLDRLAGTV